MEHPKKGTQEKAREKLEKIENKIWRKKQPYQNIKKCSETLPLVIDLSFPKLLPISSLVCGSNSPPFIFMSITVSGWKDPHLK